MEFNPSKCKVVRVTFSRVPLQTQFTLYGHVLQAVSSAKYLELDISSDLSWNTHVDTITANANKSLGFIKFNVYISIYLSVLNRSISNHHLRCGWWLFFRIKQKEKTFEMGN